MLSCWCLLNLLMLLIEEIAQVVHFSFEWNQIVDVARDWGAELKVVIGSWHRQVKLLANGGELRVEFFEHLGDFLLTHFLCGLGGDCGRLCARSSLHGGLMLLLNLLDGGLCRHLHYWHHLYDLLLGVLVRWQVRVDLAHFCRLGLGGGRARKAFS